MKITLKYLDELKSRGLAPEWLSLPGYKTLKAGYLLEGEEPRDLYLRIVEATYKRDNSIDKNLLFEMLWNNHICPASPVLANFGSERGLPISCFGSYTPDSVSGIMDTLKEVAMMTKSGGGTSLYMGSVRAHGEKISGGAITNGVIPFLKMFDATILGISQSGMRRGALAAYLPINHGDIDDFINMRRVTVEEHRQVLNLHHGVCIENSWMEDLIKGVPRNREVWKNLLKARLETGEPYLFFSDHANKDIKSGKCLSSNLCCIQGGERVVTDRGLLKAKDLYLQGGGLGVFNGEKLVKASPMHLISQNAEMFKITLKNGLTHTITKEHKVMTKDGLKECKDLKIGDKVVIQTKEGLFGTTEAEKEAFLLGLYQADGTQYKNKTFIDIWEDDFDLIDEVSAALKDLYIKYGWDKYEIVNQVGATERFRSRVTPYFISQNTGQSQVKKVRVGSTKLQSIGFVKGVIPEWVWCGTKETQWQYIRGLFYADGTTNFNKKTNIFNLSISNINRDFLYNLQILLRNLGVNFSLGVLRKAGKSLLPDGKGGKKEYSTKDCYRLTCGDRTGGLLFDENTGFLSRKGVKLQPPKFKTSLGYSKISSIEPVGTGEVYCLQVFTEDHLWTVNGVITHNSEIYLPMDSGNSFVCCLSSLNLEHFDHWHPETVKYGIKLLNAVMDEFIEKAETLPGMERAVNFAKKERALGLGVLGWHSYLQSKMIPFESFTAMSHNALIFKRIKEEVDPILEQYKNNYGIAIAPTVSNSLISGHASSGVEPLAANTFQQNSAKGTFTYRNKHLKNLMRRKGIHKSDIWRDILANGGSIQHLDVFTPEEKEVFKTAREINMFSVVAQAGQRQKWIDQGQSINLYFPTDAPLKYINDVHVEAWKLGLKGLYYCRTESALSGKIDIKYDECKSCGG